MGWYPQETISDPEIGTIIAGLIDNAETLSLPTSTITFIDSLKGAYEKYEGLTVRQFEALKKVADRFSPEKKAAREDWAANYDEEKRKIAKICAEYYLANPPYFRDLSEQILANDEFVPTERQYAAMCQNKYAERVLTATLAESLYEDGTFIAARAGKRLWTGAPAVPAVVIRTNAAPVRRAAKGAKLYEVLPVGCAEVIVVCESDIKRLKRKPKVA